MERLLLPRSSDCFAAEWGRGRVESALVCVDCRDFFLGVSQKMARQTRREFIEQSIFAAAAASFAAMPRPTRAATETKGPRSPNEKLHVACVGVNGRGRDHMQWMLRPGSDVEIVAIVDVDEAVGKARVDSVKKHTHKAPKYYRDIRQMLEDPSIDIVSIATPNHWHSLAAIWAIQAGKDVYVEKPVSHNVKEGRRLVQAARKYNRIVQAGMQSRSLSGAKEAIDFVRSGKIGEVKLARGLCYKIRGSIGPRGVYAVPKSVDYDLWLGPAPEKPLTRKSLHYDWHWIWDYGNGDLGNQGIHQMDVCRWGLDVHDIGSSVLSYGGRFGYEDAGQTANSQVSIHEYPNGKRVVFEVRGLKTPKLLGDEDRRGVLRHGRVRGRGRGRLRLGHRVRFEGERDQEIQRRRDARSLEELHERRPQPQTPGLKRRSPRRAPVERAVPPGQHLVPVG